MSSYTYRHPRPAVRVDLVIFTVLDTDLKVLLTKRQKTPFQGWWALPGDFLRVSDDSGAQGESVEDAAQRQLEKETGLPRGSTFIDQVHAFGAPQRDPRGRVISVVYMALVRPDLAPLIGAKMLSTDVQWRSMTQPVALAFDHVPMIERALSKLRDGMDRTAIAFELVPPIFTTAELRQVYEAVKGERYDAGNFRRRFRRMLTDGIIQRAPGKRQTGSRPASVYRFVGTLG
jgi:8-oxo-dGTP diphosphatase